MAQRLFYKKYRQHDHAEVEEGEIGEKVFNGFFNHQCPNCNQGFHRYTKPDGAILLYDTPDLTGEPSRKESNLILLVCMSCGWWQVTRKSIDEKMGLIHDAYAYHSLLEKVEEGGSRMEMINLRKELSKNWESRKNLDAGVAAELVRDILKEHLSCDVLHTKAHVNTPDGGIDLIIAHKNGKITSGVQVKRRQNGKAESVEYIREFVGALKIEGLESGIFVTTADRFTSDALEAKTKLFANSKMNIELIAADELLELLNATTPYEAPNLPLNLKEDSHWLANNRYFTTLEAMMGLPGNKL